ncbi:MAG TPA: hypothetical protein PLY93_03425 [Turneriella sp.]|nr:hypothetical protein [Turneriella sp.]
MFHFLLYRIGAVFLFCLTTNHLFADLSAQLTHQSVDAHTSSQTLEIEKQHENYAFSFLGQRDTLPNAQRFTNAALIASSRKNFNEHQLSLGLGAHFYQQQVRNTAAQTPNFVPAFALEWRHPRFLGSVQVSQKMTHAAIALLADLFVPVEWSSSFLSLPAQPYRWSLDAYASLFAWGGIVLGYEPITAFSRAGFFVTPSATLQARALVRMRQNGEAFAEFSLGYVFEEKSHTPLVEPTKTHAAQEKIPLRKKERVVPRFSVLVKWGLTPVEALRLSREKNICALSINAQALLKRHKWECRA